MKTTLPRSLPFLCLLVSLLLLSGCSKKSIVGKWRSTDARKTERIEFFADGKMTEDNMRGILMEYSLDGGRLTIGPKDKPPVGIRPEKPLVSFPDADHMDWTTERKYTDPTTKEEKVFKETVRFERIKEGLTVPAK